MRKDAKSIWKETYRKKRIEEKKKDEDRRKLENESFDKEYLAKRDIFSRKILGLFSINLLLLVIPVIICIKYLFKIDILWLDTVVIILMAYQLFLILKFIYLLFKSPENIVFSSQYRLGRIEKRYLLISLPSFFISCLQIYLYFDGKVLTALAVNVILFFIFTFVLIFYRIYISPQK